MESLNSLTKNTKMAAGVGIGTGIITSGLAAYYLLKRSQKAQQAEEGSVVALIGDVGGTNVRLTLRKLDMKSRTSTEIKPLTLFDAQKEPSFSECVKKFLSEFTEGSENWPKVGCVGIAGEVKDNVVETHANMSHWPPTDGKAIAQSYKLGDFSLINDFNAAGHGICLLGSDDITPLNDVTPEKNGVKVVMGPGTGLGEAFLCKSQFSKCHEVFPAEGGHTEWSPRGDIDFKLYNFAKNYIATSQNVENLKTPNVALDRLSVERVCAGPALPMIYEFMKTEHPDLAKILETGANTKSPNDIIGKDIIEAGLKRNDPLCMKVVEKFTEIFAVEVGDMGLKTLPYGGIYLVGGVTYGLSDYLRTNNLFMDTFYAKGRLSGVMQKFPVMIVKPSVELGILGAEEACYRLMGCFSKDE